MEPLIRKVELFNVEEEFEKLTRKEFPSNLDALMAFTEFLDLANATGHRGQFKAYVQGKRIHKIA